MWELDVRQTKDSVLVLMHDDTIDRTSNGKGTIRKFTFEQLQTFRLINKSDQDTMIHPIPTLREALELAKGKIMVDIDIKEFELAIKKLVQIIQKTGTEKQVIIFEQDFTIIDKIISLDSTLILMPRAKSYDALAQIIQNYHPRIIHIDDTFFTPETVKFIKDSGTRIWINGLGEPDIIASISFSSWGYNDLIENGANIIQTDKPLLLLKYLRKKKLHW